MRATIVTLLAVLATAGCGGGNGGSIGSAKDVQDGLNDWLVANASPPEDVGTASDCEELDTLRFRCTIDFPESDPYEQSYSCDLDGLCTNGAIYFRVYFQEP